MTNLEIVNDVMQKSWAAFASFKKTSLAQRATFLRAITAQLEMRKDALIASCMAESNLTEMRLKGELARTQFQLTSYAAACEQGDWLQASIDTADMNRVPVKLDIRKTMTAIGPVLVFGASNFPFAYSTAGGDTASAFAAGCTVVVKGHKAHIKTSTLAAEAIDAAVAACGLPAAVFQHIVATTQETAQLLVKHPHTKAVGFTGSYHGGKALWQIANEREEPIPVFAEMSSINPVYILPNKLKEAAVDIATAFAGSITLGCGQFCTNPGLIVGIKGDALESFKATLAEKIKEIAPGKMLTQGIADAFASARTTVLAQPDVTLLGENKIEDAACDTPSVAITTAAAFLANKNLHTEVFGSFSLIVECTDEAEMLAVANAMEGQLTTTIWGTTEDLVSHEAIVDAAQGRCGRIIFNGVPTGVEVCLSMQHGGPWPSTTDSRFGSVGASAINRFARPLSYQNWPNELLPTELQNENTLSIHRKVDNQWTNGPLNK